MTSRSENDFEINFSGNKIERNRLSVGRITQCKLIPDAWMQHFILHSMYKTGNFVSANYIEADN